LVSTMNHFIRCHVLIGQEMRWHVDYIETYGFADIIVICSYRLSL